MAEYEPVAGHGEQQPAGRGHDGGGGTYNDDDENDDAEFRANRPEVGEQDRRRWIRHVAADGADHVGHGQGHSQRDDQRAGTPHPHGQHHGPWNLARGFLNFLAQVAAGFEAENDPDPDQAGGKQG